MASTCSAVPTRLASTASRAYEGGLGLPSAAPSHHVLFSAFDAHSTQSVLLQSPPWSSMARLVLHANDDIPGHAGQRFGAFADTSTSHDGRIVGLVGVGNLSVPLRQRFFGSYIIPAMPAAGAPHCRGCTAQRPLKVLDTMDLTPASSGTQPRTRFRMVSSPAIRSIPGGDVLAFVAGSDAIGGGGREFIMRWSLGTRRAEVLLDGPRFNLTQFSAPQLCDPRPEAASAQRWLLFFAHANATAGIFTLSLAPDDRVRLGAGKTAAVARQRLTCLVDVRTPVPGAIPSQTFMAFGDPVAASSESLAVFTAEGSLGSAGIYAVRLDEISSRGHSVRRLVDVASGLFAAFPHAPSVAQGILVFYATVASDASRSGLYAMDLAGSMDDDSDGHVASVDASGLAAGVNRSTSGVAGSVMPPQAWATAAWPVVTLQAAGLTYLIARFDGFDGQCAFYYGSTTGGVDALYTVRVVRPAADVKVPPRPPHPTPNAAEATAEAAVEPADGALRCLDNDGAGVDWWFMYKTPGDYRFSYSDPSTGSVTPLAIFDRRMDDEDNPVAITRTLMALAEDSATRQSAYAPGGARRRAASMESPPARAAGLSDEQKPSYYLYNDQPDVGSASETYGHSKGVVAAAQDGKSGLWITHSTPHWPSSTGKAKFYYPDREITYGQTFLCISMSGTDLDSLGRQQLLTRPYVYHRSNFFASANSTIAAVFPHLASVLAGVWNTTPGTHTQDVKVGSWLLPHVFTVFGKNKEWDDDLWENLVAQHYSYGFVVESWIRGEELGPYCPPDQGFEVVDVQTLCMTEGGVQNVSWTETQDHAKWGIALGGAASKFVVCIGDINRMESQRNRGGGAVCWSAPSLWKGLRATINTSDVCSS